MIDLNEVKENSVTDVKEIHNMEIDGSTYEPYIVIDRKDEKVRIVINKLKLYRVLENKNQIEQALDIFIVDKIKELLDTLSKKEEGYERGK